MTALPIDLDISSENLKYETDEEYQNVFGRIFYVEPDRMKELTDVFDDERVTQGMDYMYSQTIDDEWWKKMYIKAASIFLSEEPEIGLCTLLSFTFLHKFYPLFQHYVKCPKDDPEIPLLQQVFMEFYDAEKL